MNEDTKVLQEQLLLRDLYLPEVATGIIARKEHLLFKGSEVDETIAKAITHYYTQESERINQNSLIMEVTNQLKLMKKTRRKSDKELSEFSRSLFDRLNQLYGITMDSSSNIVNRLSTYTKNVLTESTVLELAQRSEDPDFDMTQELTTQLNKINTIDLSGDATKVFDLTDVNSVDEVLDLYTELFKNQYPTGIKDIDDATAGGLAQGEVGMIGAPSGKGKTTTMVNLANSYVHQGYNVFYVALEEKASRMALRFNRLLTDSSYGDVIDTVGKTVKEGFDTRLKDSIWEQAGQRLGTLSMINKLPRTMTIDDVQREIMQQEDEKGIKYDVVFIDYPDLLLSTYHSDSEAETGGLLAQDVRRVAKQLDVVMWTATQLNRGAKESMVMSMNNIEGSFRKINTVEFAMTANQTSEEFQKGYIRYHLDKIRNRLDGYTADTLYLKFGGEALRLQEESDQERIEHYGIVKQSTGENRLDNQAKYGSKKDSNSFIQERKNQVDQFNQSANNSFGGSIL